MPNSEDYGNLEIAITYYTSTDSHIKKTEQESKLELREEDIELWFARPKSKSKFLFSF